MKVALLLCLLLLLVLASVSLEPSQIKESGQELAAIAQIFAIHKAQVAYSTSYGSYADSLGALHLTQPSGYRVELKRTASGYTALAVPKRFGRDGRRSFYSDETGVVRNSWDEDVLASAESDPVQ